MNSEKSRKQNRRTLVEIRSTNKLRFKLRECANKRVEPKSVILFNGFGSSRRYIKAVSKIYSQEIVDIDRFVNYAETLVKQKK